MEKINKKCYLYFHQGWTDIVNQLSLITYYSERYVKVYCIMRSDAKSLVDYYVRYIDNVEMLYSRYVGINNCDFDTSILRDVDGVINFHGLFDRYRINFVKQCDDLPKPKFFVNRFYECYGIDYIERVNSFSIVRDLESEKDIYNRFIESYGDNYILYHYSENSQNNTTMEPSTLELLNNIVKLSGSVNLDGISSVFFDHISVLQNAKEIHLMDSVWASIIYQIDSRYGLFKNIPITVYCLRGYQDMFTQPIQLDNWTIL